MSARITFEVVGVVLGLIFGSFLNVCISRLPKHQSIASPGSRCPSCSQPIRWYDNIPLASWLLLGGRCRNCKTRISLRYPTVEALTAVWFGIQAGHLYSVIQFYFKAQNHDLGASAAFALLANLAVTLVGFFLIGLMLMDWETGLLPDSFTFPGILLGLLIVCAQAIFLSPGQGQILVPAGAPNITSAGAAKSFGNIFMTGPEATILGRVFAVGFAACLMLLLRQGYKILRHRDGMGLGDVKLLAMIVAFLGFWPGILSLFLGTLMASAYAVFLLVRGKAGADTKIAFGSFLAAGGMVSAQIGDRIIEAYSQLLR